MKKLLSVALLSLSFTASLSSNSSSPGSENRRRGSDLHDQFDGAWRLTSLEEPEAEGKIRRQDCTGLLVFTNDGHISVQVMLRNPPAASSGAPVQYAQGGYEASFGTYVLDQNSNTFTFHVEGALVRSLIGKDLKRTYELSGNQLIVKSSDLNEHWRAVWEHY